MDVLKDKSYKKYDNISRYAEFPYYYNTADDKYMMGVTSWLNTDVKYVLINTKPTDTYHSLALTYYGRPDYYWIIADFNRIVDIFEPLHANHKTLKIPSISEISFK